MTGPLEATRTGFGSRAQAGGNATWDRLAEHLEQTATGSQRFVINRTCDAPIARVFEMWAGPAHLAKWLPPAGTTMRLCRSEVAPGRRRSAVLEFQEVSGLALECCKRGDIFRFASMTSAVMTMAKPLDGEIVF